MKVCDRHPDRQATEAVCIVKDDAYFDLCAECKTDLLRLLTEPVKPPEPPKRGRPKNSA